MRGASRPKRRKAIKGSVFSHGPGLSIATAMHNTPKPLPMQLIRESVEIDDSSPTGLRWLHRPLHHFDNERRCRQANTRAGKPAGNLSVHHSGRKLSLIYLGETQYQMSRVVYALHYGVDPGPLDLDHKDGDRHNNRVSNLRAIEHHKNCYNRVTGRKSVSGVVGVSWSKSASMWYATININKRHTVIGYFKDKEEAIAARKLAEVQHYGEYSLSSSRC